MKRVIMSSTVTDDKLCRNFANSVVNNAFEDCNLTVGFRLSNNTVMFTVYHDEARTAPHVNHNVPYSDVLETKDDWEANADLVDDVVNTLYRKNRQAL